MPPSKAQVSKLVALAAKMDADTGLTFNDYSARIGSIIGSISGNSVGNPTTISVTGNSVTNSAVSSGLSGSNLVSGRVVTISGTQTSSSSPTILGTYVVSNTGTFPSSSTFSIPVNVITAGGSGLTYSTSSNLNNFNDLEACFNEIINRLNVDPGATYSNFRPVSNTSLFEAVIVSINKKLNQITLNIALQFIPGQVTIYNSIPCEIEYSPSVLGDPLMTKHMYEATFMFNNKAFTQGTISYASDLKPEFSYDTFYGQGNGIFGHYSSPGFGFGFFGGASNSAPVRTYIPRDQQRCRFLRVGYSHSVAREEWALYGITLTGNVGLSTRGYR